MQTEWVRKVSRTVISFSSRTHFNIIFPSISRYTLFSFPQVSPAKPRTYPSSLPYVLHARSVSFLDLINRINLMRRTDHKVPHCACSLLHSPTTSFVLGPKTFLSTLFSNTHSLYVRDQVSHPYKIGKIIIRSLIFWGVQQRRFVDCFRRFGMIYQSHLQNSWRQNWYVVSERRYLPVNAAKHPRSANISLTPRRKPETMQAKLYFCVFRSSYFCIAKWKT